MKKIKRARNRPRSAPAKRRMEYRLRITPQVNDGEQKHTTRFLLETTQQFASFKYEIAVKETAEGNKIRYKILGLKAPKLSLPASGPAHFRREYENLNGPFEIIVEGLDGNANSFSVKISPTQIHLLKEPRKKFVQLVIDKSPLTTN